MKTIWADAANEPALTIAEVPMPVPTPSQALVRVHAFSLNAGDTRTALGAAEPYAPGWDFAGVIEQSAADGSTPPAGTRVVGAVARGGWAEFVAADAASLVPLPDRISFTDAAALPVAASTAYLSIELGGDLQGKRVLITGASGGVGRFAIQLAARGGAQVSAVSRRAELPSLLAADGVAGTVLHASMEDASLAGPYDFILDSVGGDYLALALTSLASNGLCVNCGNSSNAKTTFDVRDFYLKSNVRLHGLFLGGHGPGVAEPLAKVVALIAAGDLKVPVGTVRHWREIAEAASALQSGTVEGKVVLTIPSSRL
ncbi:zinc-binding dehydrogenase [Glacieibacterium frigidum]|uniref:Zinc-binding dehydrogenase n=1 Tax=Glacieibacterium frigidum TaxID=2593303 RepID=A0A552UEV9_9SPHN|nr:zinc-binding dehydrogenase [Glacieibacterium frigidum]TRW16709.1 zinc-binding dehydrogenase [Glacieibacterium frigidum]